MNHRWLLSSAGRRGALVRLLQGSPPSTGGFVIATDASRLSAAGQLADDFQIVPPIADEQFVPAMLDICRERGIQTVVPTIDTELSKYAENAADFAQAGTDVLVSSPEVVRLSMDKWELHQWLERSGFPSVETHQAHTFQTSLLPGPVVAKPRGGSSSVGVISAESSARLPNELSDDYIIQRRATGHEFTVDFAVARDGSFLGAVPRRRLEIRAGEVSKAVTVVSPALEELARDLAAALPGAYGILNVQVFADPEARSLAVIELNARVGGGYPLSYQAGADFLSPLALESNEAQDDWTDGLVMLRYDEAAFLRSDKYRSAPR